MSTTPSSYSIIDQHGRCGTADPAAFAAAQTGDAAIVEVTTSEGKVLDIPRRHLKPQPDGSYRFAGSFDEFDEGTPAGAARAGDTHHLTLGRETLRVQRETHETARVRVSTEVHEDEVIVREPTFDETAEVERVPIDRVVEGPVDVRCEGDVTIIPILEERLVVQKQLVLKEELHVRTRRIQQVDEQRVLLRRTEASVEREALSPDAPADERPPSDSP